MSFSVLISTPEKGSSSSNIDALCAIALAKKVLFLCPPDKFPIGVDK